MMAFIHPLIILLVCGEIISFSAAWKTQLQPLFIITNTATSYFLYSIKKWETASIFLLLLTAFSVDFTPMFHNFLALMFFLACIPPLYSIKRLRYFTYIYLLSVPLLFLGSLFWFELMATWVLCVYHLKLIWEVLKLGK